MFKEDEKTGDKTAIASMNDKCASGTGATIDKCMLKVERAAGARDDAALRRLEAPPRRRQVRRVRRDRHRQPGQERHPVERGPLLARRRDRPAEPLACSRAATRCKHKVLLLGGPNTYLPFLQECWRLRIPQTWDERGYDYPKDVPIEELDLRPRERAVLRGVRRGAVRPARGGRRRRATGHRRASSSTSPTAARRASARPRARRSSKDERRARRLPRALQDPEVRPGEARAGAGRARASSASTAARRRPRPCSSTRTANILAKAYQLSKGNPIQDTKELLAKLRDYVARPGRDARGASASAPPATRPTCSKSACAPT